MSQRYRLRDAWRRGVTCENACGRWVLDLLFITQNSHAATLIHLHLVISKFYGLR